MCTYTNELNPEITGRPYYSHSSSASSSPNSPKHNTHHTTYTAHNNTMQLFRTYPVEEAAGRMRGAIRRPGLAQDGVPDTGPALPNSCPTPAQLLSIPLPSFFPAFPSKLLANFCPGLATVLFVFGASVQILPQTWGRSGL